MQGTAACVLNAANEVAVEAFLQERISFLDIARINAASMNSIENILNPSLEDYISIDTEARRVAGGLL